MPGGGGRRRRRRRPPPPEWSGFLSPESLPYRICLGIYVFASLNLLIIACSLFVVTLPPGLAALFCVVRKLVRDEEPPVWRAFARYFVQNLKQSLLVGAFLAILYLLLFEDVRVLIATGAARSPALLAATVIACGLSILVSLYIFPLMAHGYFSLRQLVIGSVVVALYRPHLTAANLLILAGGLLVARRYPFLLLSCYFSLAAYMTYWFAERKFRGLFPTPDREVKG